ncbi:MAG: hypothetical protein JWR26_1622 [Pedosphaera sp.]|nr:hypothetical protein [Pedosphaera sp.]
MALKRALIAAVLLVFLGGVIPTTRASGPPSAPGMGKPMAKANATTGPTLHLDYGSEKSAGNPITEFMYFVALIAPEPVSMTNNAGNTQAVRVLAMKRHVTNKSFVVTCEFEFTGEGFQRNILDHSEQLRKRQAELKAGGAIEKLLNSINVEGGGFAVIEAEGVMNGGVPTVTEVRLRFNGRGHESPVSVEIGDIRSKDGVLVTENAMVARVNTLTFRKQAGQPKMELSLASVKRKEAGNSAWQNFVGGLKGTAANLFLKPTPVEAVGNDAMMSFGLAIASEARTFTFPFAKNLRSWPPESK